MKPLVLINNYINAIFSCKLIIGASIIWLFFPSEFLIAKSKADSSQIKFKLPSPTGNYSISTEIFSITDSTRFDTAQNALRIIPFQIWYPSSEKSIPPMYYIPSTLVTAMVKDQYNNVDSLTITQWEGIIIHASLTNTNTIPPKKFPILFFLHGFGVSRYSYISIIEDLVSHGFVVVSVDSPHSGLLTLPDGKAVSTIYDGKPIQKCENMAMDVKYIMDWLQRTKNKSIIMIKKNVDFNKAGVLGHSLGGAAALETCRIDNRFSACIDLDGDPFGKVEEIGLSKPTLILLNEPLFTQDRFKTPGSRAKWDSMGYERKKLWQNIFQKNKKNPSYAVRILGTNHYTFTDFPFVTTQYYKNPNAGIIIDKNRGLLIISSYIRAFFDRFVLKEKTISIKNMPKKFRETNLYLST